MAKQFYPTPTTLALKAWGKFENKNIRRLLEPSAGQGSLIGALIDFQKNTDVGERIQQRKNNTHLPFLSMHSVWDAIEINPNFHSFLRDKNAKIIGYDFLSFEHGATYSHIIMNPPFAEGVHHVLHAWDILFDGEIVAILNAETIKNPYSKERQLLVKIIEENNGTIEYHQEAFITEDTVRKTSVEVVVIHLKKVAQSTHDLLNYLTDLTKKEAHNVATTKNLTEVALPNNFVENAVINYNLAIKASLEAQIAIQKAKSYHDRLISNTSSNHEDIQALESKPQELMKQLLKQEYDSIHKDAWRMVIDSCILTSRLTRSTAKEVESQLELIYELAFNATNIYGFLLGLAEQRGEIQKSMLLEIFDDITRYHSTNTCYYLGWKSNDKHRTIGKSIKMSRFILPLGQSSWRGRQDIKTLQDIEATFLYLDGKASPTLSLPRVFEDPITSKLLTSGERLTTDYFDIRYYPQRGTMHFFPRRADLVQRLNVFVGKARQWIPEDMQAAAPSFQEQFEKAEAISKRFNLAKELKTYNDHELHRKLNDGDTHILETVTNVLIESQEQLSIITNIEDQSTQQLALM